MICPAKFSIILPVVFFPACFLILLCANALRRVTIHYENDNLRRLIKSFTINLLISFLFIGLQVSGLVIIFKQFVNFQYVFLFRDVIAITSYHLAGIFLLPVYKAVNLFQVIEMNLNRVKCLIYFTAAREKLKRSLLRNAWLFGAYLWLFLYVYILMIR